MIFFALILMIALRWPDRPVGQDSEIMITFDLNSIKTRLTKENDEKEFQT